MLRTTWSGLALEPLSRLERSTRTAQESTLKLQRARVRRARHHVSKQGNGAGREVEAEPGFQHFAQRRDRHPTEENCTEHQRNEMRSHTRVTLRAGEERKRRQTYQLLPRPESRAATSNLFEQVADESFPRTGAAEPSQEP